jgi:hypothetical protein
VKEERKVMKKYKVREQEQAKKRDRIGWQQKKKMIRRRIKRHKERYKEGK